MKRALSSLFFAAAIGLVPFAQGQALVASHDLVIPVLTRAVLAAEAPPPARNICISNCVSCDFFNTYTRTDGYPGNSLMDPYFDCGYITCGSNACAQTGPLASALNALQGTRRDYEQLIKAVTVASRSPQFEQARELLADPRVHLNTVRSSLQVIGCDGQSVIANFPLRAEVATRLAQAVRDSRHALIAGETSGN